jgi:iron complex transport system substrate-binding protein
MTIERNARFFYAVLGLIIGMLLIIALMSYHADDIAEPVPAGMRVVSLGPSVTAVIHELGAGDCLVGNTTFCDDPPGAQITKVGTVTNLSVEKIMNLEPDLVVAISLSKPYQLDRLRQMGLRVEVCANPRTFEQLCAQYEKVGALVNMGEKAAAAAGDARDRVGRIAKKVEGRERRRIFVQIGAEPLFTVTDDSFINDYIRLAGGVNVAAGAKTGRFRTEKVVEADPEVIIVATMGASAASEAEKWKAYRSLSAVRNNRVHVLDAGAVCSPTPGVFADTLEKMIELVHPSEEK